MRRLLLLAAALGGCNRNFAVPAAADRTPPVLTRFAASPPFAKAGATVTITFDANEPLGAAPTITASFLTGSPVCAGAVPGTRFVCTGASIAAAAPIGTATFTATGADRAGNSGASALGSIQVQNPVLPPPQVS